VGRRSQSAARQQRQILALIITWAREKSPKEPEQSFFSQPFCRLGLPIGCNWAQLSSSSTSNCTLGQFQLQFRATLSGPLFSPPLQFRRFLFHLSSPLAVWPARRPSTPQCWTSNAGQVVLDVQCWPRNRAINYHVHTLDTACDKLAWSICAQMESPPNGLLYANWAHVVALKALLEVQRNGRNRTDFAPAGPKLWRLRLGTASEPKFEPKLKLASPANTNSNTKQTDIISLRSTGPLHCGRLLESRRLDALGRSPRAGQFIKRRLIERPFGPNGRSIIAERPNLDTGQPN